ncbi:MAG: diphosphomevalonate decarboxylase, partial [Deltaproteobacteria bacterium]|nr:diphosphomevalonate decarboxylase [Deltaproteobacteria bacterium]
MRKVKVFSPTNIALAKYWGKRDPTLNLPANSSLSVTLADFGSETEVVFDSRFKKDVFILNGKEIPGSRVKPGMTRWERILNILRDLKKEKVYAQVTSFNNFPTAAGLASSASGMSALTLAGAKALELDLSKEKLSHISRLGSGSSCR